MRADARRNRVLVLEAAKAIFAERGPAASTEEVAARASVGIGTVFRHFPTKRALLEAVLMDRVAAVGEAARALANSPDPGPALFRLVNLMVDQSAEKRSYVDALGDASLDSRIAQSDVGHQTLLAIERLLTHAQQAGAVRRDVQVAELIALVVGASRASEHSGWKRGVRAKVLEVIFDGLRPGNKTRPRSRLAD